jgi:hypothetical protein
VFPVAGFLPDRVVDNLDALAVFPDRVADNLDALAAFPALVPVVRFMSALAAPALAELSRDPCPVLFAPARREEAVLPAARVAGLTLSNLPFGFL